MRILVPSRPLVASVVPGKLLLQDEGNLQVDLVADDVTVLDHDVHVLHPGALDVAQGLIVARSRAFLLAASKPSGETALISLTLATLMLFLPHYWRTECRSSGKTGHDQAKGPSSERMSASEIMPTSLSPSTTRTRSSSC
jgi:hypothetical protein